MVLVVADSWAEQRSRVFEYYTAVLAEVVDIPVVGRFGEGRWASVGKLATGSSLGEVRMWVEFVGEHFLLGSF